MRPLTLTFKLPDKDLSPNRKKHWTVKYRLNKTRRSVVQFDSICQMRHLGYEPTFKYAMVSIRWYAKTLHFPDADNALASLKSTVDGLADAKCIVNDRYLSYAPIEFHKDKSEPRVEITLTEVE